MKKNRKQLPLVAKFNVNIDVDLLKKECDTFSTKFIDVQSANPGLCDNHEKMSVIYQYFEEVPLTTNTRVFEPTQNIKERILRREEMYWNNPTEEYLNSYFKKITDQFRAPVTRVRLTKLPPGKDLVYHVDYDPTYAVRCIVPIYTNPNVKNMFRVNGEEISYYLEEGNAYFINTGIEHAVVNASEYPRIALLFSLDGQEDLENITNV